MRENKGYFIGEFIVMILTIGFIFKLNLYNKVLYDIQDKYHNKIEQVSKIVNEPDYFRYLLFGAIFILLLVGYTILGFKSNIGIEVGIVVLINFILLIVLLKVFWNPVLATFATLLIGVGIFSVANN